MKTATTNRKNSCNNGVITFDGITIFKDGKPVETFAHVVEIVSAALKDEKLIIAFYRNGFVHFKQVTRAEFLQNPEKFLYFNGNSDCYEFSFRFLSQYADYYMGLPDAIGKNGKPLTIAEPEFCEKYNHLIENRITSKYGYICEYHISGNPKDLKDRTKKHDVYTYYITAHGTKSKYQTATEVKACMAGQKGTSFIAYSKSKGIVPLSPSYSKTNALFRAYV